MDIERSNRRTIGRADRIRKSVQHYDNEIRKLVLIRIGEETVLFSNRANNLIECWNPRTGERIHAVPAAELMNPAEDRTVDQAIDGVTIEVEGKNVFVERDRSGLHAVEVLSDGSTWRLLGGSNEFSGASGTIGGRSVHVTRSPTFAIYDDAQVSRIPKILHSSQLGRLRLWAIRRQISSKPVGPVIIGELDGREVIVSGDYHGGIQVWDGITRKLTASLLARHKGSVSSLALHKNFILSAGADMTIRIWSFSRQEEVAVIEIGERIESLSCAFGDYLAITTDRGVVTFDLMLDG